MSRPTGGWSEGAWAPSQGTWGRTVQQRAEQGGLAPFFRGKGENSLFRAETCSV